MDQQAKLLHELVTGRYNTYSLLADEAEDRGAVWEAIAWRWMRDRAKYPNPRKGGKWGWVFNDYSHKYNDPACSNSLPYELYHRSYMNTVPFKEIEDALINAVNALAKWLELKESRKIRK